MFGLFLTGAVLNFVMIFASPLAVSSRPPQTIKAWAAAYSASNGTHVGLSSPPHRRRTFIWLRSFPFLILSFFTALVTIVASAVATVMFSIFANVFTNADPSLNINAHVGKQMLAFMWVGSAFSFLAFIYQFGSCCASCCGGHRARKQLKSQGVDVREKPSLQSNGPDAPAEPHVERNDAPHAVSTD